EQPHTGASPRPAGHARPRGLARGQARAPTLLGRRPCELRDHVLPVGLERLLLAMRHEVDREVVDADRLELAKLRGDLVDVAEHGEAVADLVGDELAVPRADA